MPLTLSRIIMGNVAHIQLAISTDATSVPRRRNVSQRIFIRVFVSSTKNSLQKLWYKIFVSGKKMNQYKKLTSYSCALPVKDIPDEALEWMKYKHPVNFQMSGRVNAIEFSPSDELPDVFFIATGNKLQSINAHKSHYAFFSGNFLNRVMCCALRKDYSMIAGAEETGYLKIFHAKTKHLLRRWKIHDLAARAIKFSQHKVNLFSCSEDRCVKIFDVATSECLNAINVFSDKVTCLDVEKFDSPDVFVAGGYDQTWRLFDSRLDQPQVVSLKHSQPIDTIKVFGNGNMVVTGGGRFVKIWDLRFYPSNPENSSASVVATLADHHKNVMCVRFNKDESRLLTGGVDRLIKVYPTDVYNCVHTINYTAPVVTFDISRDDRHLVVGMTDDTVCLKSKADSGAQEPVNKDKEDAEESGVPSKRQKIVKEAVAHSEKLEKQNPSYEVIKQDKHKRLSKMDQKLKKFDHSGALDTVLVAKPDAETAYSLLFELYRRGLLEKCIQALDCERLKNLLVFLNANICNSTMCDFLSLVYGILLDTFSGSKFLKTKEVIQLLKACRQKITNKIRTVDCLQSFASQMEILETAVNNYYENYKFPVQIDLSANDENNDSS